MSAGEDVKEKGGFEQFASQALRMQRKGSYEALLCQHLITSVSIDPMNKIRLILEAAYMVDPDKIKLDITLIDTIYTTCLSFLNTIPKVEYTSVAWAFDATVENYERFIQPWRRKTDLLFSSSTYWDTEEKRELLKKAKNGIQQFFLFTTRINLSVSSFQVLKSEFLRWAIPQAMKVFEKLTRLVQPDLYKEILQILRPEVSHP